jgi:hypothetical protein
MRLPQMRFRIAHLLGLVTACGLAVAIVAQLGYEDIEIEIIEFRNFGSLEVRVRTEYEDGRGIGSIGLPYRLAPDELDELVGSKLHTRCRASQVLWMAPNDIQAIRIEVCAAIDELLARRENERHD